MSIITPTLVVEPGRTVLEYRDGKLTRTLSAGRHRESRGAQYVSVDLRERLIPVATQEIMTADTMPVRISLMIRAAVTDPAAFVERSADPIAAVYLSAQIALRGLVGDVTAEALIRRADLDPEPLRAAAGAAGAQVGIEVSDVVIKDIILPAEVRSATLELITAKARGAAKLETARAETAALRSMANAGRMLEANPALARLRLVQELPYGSKLVMAVGDSDAAAELSGD